MRGGEERPPWQDTNRDPLIVPMALGDEHQNLDGRLGPRLEGGVQATAAVSRADFLLTVTHRQRKKTLLVAMDRACPESGT